jgi:hypothetical protein
LQDQGIFDEKIAIHTFVSFDLLPGKHLLLI